MKKIISIILTLTLAIGMLGCVTFSSSAALSSTGYDVSVWDGVSTAAGLLGSGTEADPYLINDAAELALLRDMVNGQDSFEGKYIRLTTNINLNGNSWSPIGNSTSTIFKGHFDGNGKVIYNFTCTYSTAGLFGYATAATIKNLKVDFATFTVGTRYCGAIVGLQRGGTVSGCVAGPNVLIQSDILMMDSAQCGGVVGWSGGSADNPGLLENCVSYATLKFDYTSGSSFLGGVVGVASASSTVKNCVNYGSVSSVNENQAEGKNTNVGGVAGGVGASKGAGDLQNCINFGTVSGKGGYVGGVFGRIHIVDSAINNCFNLGEVIADEGRGGTVGGDLGKAHIAAGNLGVISASATAPYALLGEGVETPAGGFAIGTKPEIELNVAYLDILAAVEGISKFDAVDPANDPQLEVPQDTTTEEQEVTTTAPVDETTKPTESTTTKAPGDVTTTKPVDNTTTKAPDTTVAPEEKGCGGFVGAGFAIFAAIIGSVVFVKVKKY